MNKEKMIEVIFILFIIILGIYYMYLATQTTFLGEDEAVYFALGKQISNFEYPVKNHLGMPVTAPLLVPMIYALFFMLFGTSLAVAKMISALFGLLTLLIVYLLGRKINVYVGIFSVSVLLLIFLFTHFMFLAYVDVPIAFFSAISLYMISKIDSKKSAIIAGLVIGASYYVKESGVFIPLTLFLYALYVFVFQKDKNQFKLYLISFVTSFLFILVNIIKNVALFGYPYFMLLDIFFPPVVAAWAVNVGITKIISPSISTFPEFANIFSWLPMILAILSLTYMSLEWKKIEFRSLKFASILFVLFILNFVFLYSLGKAIAESRYFIIIFPQLALVSGFYLWKLKEYRKYLLVLVIPIVLFGFYTSITTAVSTSQSSRFPANYIEALRWIRDNTPKDSLVFTTYSGSGNYFSERNIIWSSVEDFPEIMKTQNSTYIYDNLKKYNISYILIWRGVLSQDYLIPGSNIAGVFTYNFLDKVTKDSEHFNVTYQNQDNIVIKLN